MNRSRVGTAALVCAFWLMGCTSTPTHQQAASSNAVDRPAPAAERPGIRLPAGATASVPQEPGGGQKELMLEGVYSQVSNGITVTAVAGESRRIAAPGAGAYTATSLQISEVLDGDPATSDVMLLNGSDELGLRRGQRYLLVLHADTSGLAPHAYTLGSPVGLLEPSGTDAWVSRDKSVTITLAQMRNILAMSKEHLAARQRAGEAHLKLTMVGIRGGYRVTVSGYAVGDTLDLAVCLPAKGGANPAASFDRCDLDLGESVTPRGPEQSFEITPPTKVQTSPGAWTECANTCVVAVYDIDFRTSVYATARI